MKNPSSIPDYCDYSFDDLHKAAYGKKLDSNEKTKLQNLPQEKINTLVAKWAKKAGWKIQNKKGTDNKIYTAFSPLL